MTLLLKRMTWPAITLAIVLCLLMITPVSATGLDPTQTMTTQPTISPHITVTGIVIDHFTGLPVSGITIYSYDNEFHYTSTISQQDGRFTLPNVYVSGENVEINTAESDYYYQKHCLFSVSGFEGSMEVGTIEITPYYAGYVTDRVTGQPLSDVHLTLTSDPSSPNDELVGRSDGTGYYRIGHQVGGFIQNRGLRDGDHILPPQYLTATRDGYQPYIGSTSGDEYGSATLHNIALVPVFAAQFYAFGHVGQAPYSVRFLDQSTGSPTAWHWDFGDGTNSTEQNPTHIYNRTGVYNVALTASNEQMSDTSTQYRCVIVNTVPAATFTANATAGQTPFTVQFTDLSTAGADGYQWQFGDGQTSTEQNPVHTYTSPGSYTVTLITTVPDYGSVFSQKPGYITVNDPSTAGFSANVTAGLAPLPVQFNPSVNGSVQYFYWQFGDGSTSNDQNPVHVYDAAGSYTVSLYVIGSNGTQVKTIEDYINITAPVTPTTTPTPTGVLPEANFTVTADAPGSMSIQVTDTSVNATSVRYDLGDGTTTTYPNFRFTYWQAGTYTIEQTATNEAGSTKKTLAVTVPAAVPTTTATVTPTVTTTSPAYNGPHTIPGILQAEDYDLGGEGVAYHDTTIGNTGGAYRHDDVDIEQLDIDGSPNVGWVRTGEWLAYTVDVAHAGTYTAGFRVASTHAGSSIQVSVDDSTTPVATVNVPNTGDWPVFQTVSVPVTLPAGQHRLKFSFPADYVNINWVTFAT